MKVMRRLSKENVKEFGRKLAKHSRQPSLGDVFNRGSD